MQTFRKRHTGLSATAGLSCLAYSRLWESVLKCKLLGIVRAALSFYRPDFLCDAKPTVSEHGWDNHNVYNSQNELLWVFNLVQLVDSSVMLMTYSQETCTVQESCISWVVQEACTSGIVSCTCFFFTSFLNQIEDSWIPCKKLLAGDQNWEVWLVGSVCCESFLCKFLDWGVRVRNCNVFEMALC